MSEEITRDSAYNLSIMILQSGDIKKKDRQHLMDSIKFYEAALTALRAEKEELEKRVKELEYGMQLVKASDRSRPYEYGERRADGKIPGFTSKYLTPCEIAEKYLTPPPAAKEPEL